MAALTLRQAALTIDLPSPTTGELLAIEFLPATVEDYNWALRNAKP